MHVLYLNKSSPENYKQPFDLRKNKIFFNTVHEYISSAEGIGKVLEIIETTANVLQRLPLKKKSIETAKKIESLSSLASSFLIFREFPGQIENFKKNTFSLKTAIQLTSEHPLKNKKITSSIKKVVVDGTSLINSGAIALDFCHQAKILKLGKMMPTVNGMYYATNLISDSIDSLNQIEKIYKTSKEINPKNELAAKRLSSQKNLCQWKLIRNIFSIILSLAALGGALFNGLGFVSLGFFSCVILIISVFYLLLSISLKLYEKSLYRK